MFFDEYHVCVFMCVCVYVCMCVLLHACCIKFTLCFTNKPTYLFSIVSYHIRIGGDFNLTIWQIRLRSPNLMYTNTPYNHMYYEQCTLNIILFAKLKSLQVCITSQFAKLIVHQIYCVNSIVSSVEYILLLSQ